MSCSCNAIKVEHDTKMETETDRKRNRNKNKNRNDVKENRKKTNSAVSWKVTFNKVRKCLMEKKSQKPN